MGKIVLCTQAVADQLKELTSGMDTPGLGYGGMKVIVQPDFVFKGWVDKEGNPVDMVVVDESVFRKRLSVEWTHPGWSDLITEGSHE